MADNIKAQEKNGVLVLTIDLKQEQGDSKSGNSVIIASTGGNQSLSEFGVAGEYGKLKIGLNLYRSKKK